MKLYCNDCGNSFHTPGDPDMYQMFNGCICDHCLHETGDCIYMYTACEKCREEHADGKHFDAESEYCWFCIRKVIIA